MTGLCQQCGAILPADDPLGGGQCAACLWKELMPAASRSGPAYRDMVPGHEIIEEIGRGGMGLVYRARQVTPPREVALKMLLPLDSGQAELRDRFRGEARALAELEHPAILPLYLVGEADGLPYFTMKLAAGGTLADKISRDGKWNTKDAAELMVLVGGGVQFAHEHGVIHRDLKPANILVDAGGSVKLLDFGIAKLLSGEGSTDPDATLAGQQAFTPDYAAPEQVRGESVSTATDLYSLGVVLYELLTGSRPFPRSAFGPVLVADAALPEPPSRRALSQGHRADAARLRGDLDTIVATCLQPEPARRYRSVTALRSDLQRYLAGQPIEARPDAFGYRTA